MKNAKKKTRTKHDKLNTQIKQMEADKRRLEADLSILERARHNRAMQVFELETRMSIMKCKVAGLRQDVYALRDVLNSVEI